MPFEFATASRVIFGEGAIREISSLAGMLGSRALVVTGKDQSRAEPLLGLLKAHHIESWLFSVSGEPQLETIRNGITQARQRGCNSVISFGGGSALDAGKAIAGMATNPGELLDYLEIIGNGQALSQPGLPFIAIPTTAGTGTEVTRNAVLASPQHRVKVSLRSPFLLARVALVDPELTYDLPATVTAATGLDALTQLIEPYVCLRANPLTDSLCLEGIPRVARSLRAAFGGARGAARHDMSLASLFGGMALANAGLGAVHGFAAPIGGMFTAPHGAVCAILLPGVMATNIRALQQRHPKSESLNRYEHVARLLTGEASAKALEGVAWVQKLVTDLRIPPLSVYGIAHGHIADLVSKAAVASSMKPNPITLNESELAEILTGAL